MKKKQAEYRLIKCMKCNRITGYNHKRYNVVDVHTLCFDCLTEKAKKEYEIMKIKRNRLFDWND